MLAFWDRISSNKKLAVSFGTLVVPVEEVPIFYQGKAPSVCHIVVEEEIELKPGTEVIVCGKLEPGFERNYGTPGILEGLRKNTAEKLGSTFCVARSLTVPKEGNTSVGMANFSEQIMLLKPGQTVAQFYPLDRVDASANLFEVEKTRTGNLPSKITQDTQGQMPLSGPPVWEQGVCAENSGLSEEEKRSFTDLLDEYGNLFATGDGKLGQTHLLEHTIDTGSATPIKQAPHRLPLFKRDNVYRQLSNL